MWAHNTKGKVAFTVNSEAPALIQATLEELVVRARALIVPGQRRILGVTGAPGAGKSTLCAALARQLADTVIVAMDGFHLANRELERLGRRQRKGAPDTFDADGYAALLGRLRQPTGQTIYAPYFDRTLEESIGSAVPVPPDIPLVLTEGNYLLLNDDGWSRARAAMDVVWFLDVTDEARRQRLVLRHEAYGKPREEAERWVGTVDQRNADIINETRSRADLVVQLVERAPT